MYPYMWEGILFQNRNENVIHENSTDFINKGFIDLVKS